MSLSFEAYLIVVDDGLEAVPMSVEVVFIPDGIEIPDPSGRVAQQGVRKLIECSDLCLIAKPSDLKQNSRGFRSLLRFLTS